MNSWKNAALAALATVVLALIGVVWAGIGVADAKQDAAIERLQEVDRVIDKERTEELQRLSGFEAKQDIMLQDLADIKRELVRIRQER